MAFNGSEDNNESIDRFTWSVVALAIVLVAAAVGSVALLQDTAPPPDLSRPEGVVRAYVEAIDSEHPERAWDLLHPSARDRTTREEFIRRATELTRDRVVRVVIDSVEVDGGTAVVRLSRTYGSGRVGLFGSSGYTTTTTVRLERDGGAWRITVPPEPFLLDPPPSPRRAG
ncbi:MAG TPA: hypothetical protein VHS99_03425 [Chloroflexota bacterium]|nr:hypothetical protein [Chloroflexota bacterium]